jgi:hypothetical protein
MLIVVVSAACVSSIILLPLRTSIWGFIAIVRDASRGDAVDVSPLMGGNWGFGHSATQAVCYGALLVILGMVYLPRWRKLEGFQRWLLAVALLNFAANIVLTARALNMSAYWAFLLEIGAWSANHRICVEQACPHSARDSRPVARVCGHFTRGQRTARADTLGTA